MPNIDKVQLEQTIDKYLQDEIPLSFLLDQYELNYPQMKLLINRTISYNRKTDYLNRNYPNSSYDNVSQEFIAIPHEIEEEYPLTHDEQVARFARIEEIRDTIPTVSSDIIRIIDTEIGNCRAALQAINTDEIAKAEKIAQEICNMKSNDEDFEDIFRRNFVTPQEFHHLNEVYTRYLELREKYSNLIQKKNEATVEWKTAKRMNRELENLRSELVVHNIKLVNYCVRYFFSGVPLPQDEAQLYGLEGLARAIQKFDYKRNFHFSTYAVPAIVRTIQRHFKEMTGLSWAEYRRKEYIRYYREWYKREIGSEAYDVSARTLAESGLVPLTEDEINVSDKMLNGVASLSDVREPFEDESEFGKRKFPATFEEYDALDSYIDTNEESIDKLEEQFAGRYINTTLVDVIMQLPVRNAQAIIARFGLDGTGYKSLEETGRIFNVGKERARQIVSKGIRLLRHPSRVNQLRGLLEYFDQTDELTITDGLNPYDGPKLK